MKPLAVILSAAAVLSVVAAPTIHGEEKPMSELAIVSPAFPHSGMIPKQYTVITSYSIHYTKLYDTGMWHPPTGRGNGAP